MSGTKRIYNLEEKNYFKFFGIEQKQNISVRSLTAHYKKIISILKQDNTFLSKDKQRFADRAFESLVDPISRAKYILMENGVEVDARDGAGPTDFMYINNLQSQYELATTVEDIENFILELKDQTSFIKEQIEYAIDISLDYKMAAGLLSRFYELSEIHKKSKEKKLNLQNGIKYVVFDR